MILRKRFKDGYQVNIWMNGGYHLIDKNACPEKFKETCMREFGEENGHFADRCFAFVFYTMPCGTHINEPLYEGETIWVLSPDGQLFETLSKLTHSQPPMKL